ncbi:hypothetical protein KCU90_g154, partial [Aureobasidium melanogenum]
MCAYVVQCSKTVVGHHDKGILKEFFAELNRSRCVKLFASEANRSQPLSAGRYVVTFVTSVGADFRKNFIGHREFCRAAGTAAEDLEAELRRIDKQPLCDEAKKTCFNKCKAECDENKATETSLVRVSVKIRKLGKPVSATIEPVRYWN